MTYKISDNGLLQIKLRECLHDKEGNPICNLEAYAATANEAKRNKYTISYGNTFYADGSPVKKGDKITQKQADQLFVDVVQHYVDFLNPQMLHCSLTQNQFDALVSFVYNIGKTNFVNSTVNKLLHQGQYANAGNQFVRWVYQDGKKLDGLVKRRMSERAQYFS